MSAVYRSAMQELRLQAASRSERELLASCILALANTYTDQHRLLAKAVQSYGRNRDNRRKILAVALTSQPKMS